MNTLTVLGAGAWGTALAIRLAGRHRVRLWARDAGQIERMRAERCNTRYLPGCPLPDAVQLCVDSDAALDRTDLVLIVTPSAALRDTLRALARSPAARVPVLWACKGIIAAQENDAVDMQAASLIQAVRVETPVYFAHQIAAEELPAGQPCGVLTGPSFAREIAGGLPAALLIASEQLDFAQTTATRLHDARLRIYPSTDVLGAELGGALKNVIAIAAGVVDGLALGHNARAALMTRGLAEITRLGIQLGARAETFMGLSGLGDLVLTCTGELSRNRRVGLLAAQGYTLTEITAQLGHVAEGVHTVRTAVQLARQQGIDLPIAQAVCALLFEQFPAPQVIAELLGRAPREREG